MWVRASAAPRRRGGGGRRMFTLRAAAESGTRTPGWRAGGVGGLSACEPRSRPGGWARSLRRVPLERVR